MPGERGRTEQFQRGPFQRRGIIGADPLEMGFEREVTHVAADLRGDPLIHLLPTGDSGATLAERRSVLVDRFTENRHNPHSRDDDSTLWIEMSALHRELLSASSRST